MSSRYDFTRFGEGWFKRMPSACSVQMTVTAGISAKLGKLPFCSATGVKEEHLA